MGVRLIRYSRTSGSKGVSASANDHDALINRDLLNQHPIYAIIGLQEVLNILEDSIADTNRLLLELEANVMTKYDTQISIINNNIDDINIIIDGILAVIPTLNTIENIEDTKGIDLDYNSTTKTLKADVVIYQDKNDTNNLQLLAEGLYVPKVITEDTDTIALTIISNGETLKDIYDNGIRFSHNKNSWNNVYNASEVNAWYWDDAKQSFVQPNNTTYFTGFVTSDFYDYYTHQTTIKSTGADNDLNGLIIGFVFDENNNPHTLSVVVQRGSDFGSETRYALVYDYYLPDQQIIYYKLPGNQGSGNWSDLTNGITIQATKYKNKISCMCSDWNSTTLNPNSLMEIDLDDYSWGYLFKDKVRYGYCNQSQANTYFTNIDFLSDNTAANDIISANVRVSQSVNNAIKIYSDGIYSEAFLISTSQHNALTKDANGYYVEAFKISAQADNVLQKLNDGYYVRDTYNYKTVNQNAHNFTVGQFIYYHPNNAYQLASAIDSYDSNIVGMVTKVIDADNFEYMWGGFFPTTLFNEANGYTQGMPIYISDTIPGGVTQSQPDISKSVGYPVENKGLIISIERGIQYNQEATIGDFKRSANNYNIRSDGFIKVEEGINYKLSIVLKLLDVLTDDFKDTYIDINDDTGSIKFKNTQELKTANGITTGFNLYIKAF